MLEAKHDMINCYERGDMIDLLIFNIFKCLMIYFYVPLLTYYEKILYHNKG
jgi:hypothetical protein